MLKLELYNTLTKQREVFCPIDSKRKRVSFYSCGPTVYDYSHIGNFRSFLNADLLRRTLELLGYKVRHVMNMTDVGHMTEDDLLDGGGEDKMAAAAQRLRAAKNRGELPEDAAALDPANPVSIAEYYIHAFQHDARMLGVKVAIEAQDDPSRMPRPTQYVNEMIALTETLIERGHAYVASDGVVYFDVQSFPEYGRLSGNTPDKIRSGEGGRVSDSDQSVKKHAADFLLWKPDPNHLMRWQSPWGEGYPGWHLECSVMAQALLGDEIDIHSGGEDNIFPHHDCEIAQTRCATGRDHFARYWFHTRHLMVEGEKMSKSLGNFFTMRDLIARGGTPAAIRLALTSTQYRSNANFTMQGLRDAQRQIDRWMSLDRWLSLYRGFPRRPNKDDPCLADALKQFTNALCDDLNVAGAIGALNEAYSQYGRRLSEPPYESDLHHDLPTDATFETERRALRRMLSTLGIWGLETEHIGTTLTLSVSPHPAAKDTEFQTIRVVEIEEKIKQRNEARSRKDFEAADRIRNELRSMGIEIKDSENETTWTRIVQ